MARTAGLRLETTYTGKCLASLRQRAERGVAFDGPVLFRNTHNDVDLAALAPRSPASCALPPVFHRRLDQGR